MKFLSTSLIEFFANLHPNFEIFDSVDSPSSLLFKSINFPNFSAHFIILFDQISKDI